MPSRFHTSWLEQESISRALLSAEKHVRGKVLDLGCGAQPYAFLARSRGLDYVPVDLSILHTPPPIVCADSLTLPFKDGSFDTVLSTQVVEHVADPFMMFAEISRVLKPHGRLVMTAPQVWPLHEEPHDYFRYTRYGLEELARRSGLQVLELRERGGAIMAITQLSAALLYDLLGKWTVTRLPLKLLLTPIFSLTILLDRFLFIPQFTLGYLLVAEKPAHD
jgi:SAM-dependent methyltransferase